MATISKTQLAILRNLANAIQPACRDCTGRSMRLGKSLAILETKGLIARKSVTTGRWTFSQWTITDAGRAALNGR